MRDNPYNEAELSEARIGSQLSYMEENISKLNAVVLSLQDRIDQVLVPEMLDKNVLVEALPRKPASEISNTIDDLNLEITRLHRCVNNLIERVQL